jgi:uncharacterized MAPEG superfamily protein
MKKNIGAADRIIRLLLAVVFAVLILTGQVTGTLAVILAVLAVAFIGTSAVSFCPFYFPFKMSTRKSDGMAGK